MGRSSVSDYTPLILGGALVYVLYKSDVFKGLGKVSTGIGETVSGTGQGVVTAAQGLGAGVATVAQDIGQTTSNIADFLNPLGALGNWISEIEKSQQSFQTQYNENEARKRQEAADREYNRQQEQDKITDKPVVESRSAAEIEQEKQKSLRVSKVAQEQTIRSSLIQGELTEWTQRITRADEAVIGFVKKVVSVTPPALAITALSKVTTLRTSTGAASGISNISAVNSGAAAGNYTQISGAQPTSTPSPTGPTTKPHTSTPQAATVTITAVQPKTLLSSVSSVLSAVTNPIGTAFKSLTSFIRR